MRTLKTLGFVLLVAGCQAGSPEPGGGASPGGPGGSMTQATGGSRGGSSGTGGSSGSGGASVTGGWAGSSGGAGGSGGSSGSGGSGGTGPADATVASDAAITDGRTGQDGPAASGDGAGPTAPGQGPTAEGQIVYSQDFENGHAGITFSPTNLPMSRAMIVDDPLGQRGKVMRLQWLVGDNYRIGQYRPRANISNTGFYYNSGDKVSYAWGYMTDTDYIGATLAQNITGGDPIWMLRGRANGELDVIPGGNGLLPFKIEAKQWYDIRAEINYVGGAAGTVDIFINGTKVFSRKGGLAIGPRAHWDGGIYLTSFGQTGAGNSTARTVYISNLSVGKK